MLGLGNKMTTGGKLVTIPDQVSVDTVSDPGETSFTLDGSYISATNVTAVGFQYSVSEDMSSPTTVNATLANPFTADVTGLTAATTYYYRAFATNTNGTLYSVTRSLITDAASLNSPPPTPSGYTLVYTADWSSDTDGWYSTGTVAQVTGDVDTVSDDNSVVLNNVLEVSRAESSTNASFWAAKNLFSLLGTIPGNNKTYIAVADVLVPSSNSAVNGMNNWRFGNNSESSLNVTPQGEWYRATSNATAFTTSSIFYLFATNAGTDKDDKFYIGNLWLYESN